MQVTVVSPGGKREPLAGAQTTLGLGSVSSLTLGSEKVTIAPVGLCCSTLRSGAGPIVGGSWSRTVTTKVTAALFPAASVAVQVTVVGPGGKREPEAGVQVTTGVGSAASCTTGGA